MEAKFSYPEPIALELVPNSIEGLLTDCHAARAYSQIGPINIPEMRSKALKPYQAATPLLQAGFDVIPHFRTIDRTYEQLEALITPLIPQGLRQVLLISGDPIADPSFHASDLTPVNAIPRLKKAFPGLKVFTGFDQYRQGFRAELEYCQRKLDAGSDGFFTQPFFCTHLLEAWLSQLQQTQVWAGVSPVTTASFKAYWEKTNHVVFPPNFSISLDENCQNERDLFSIAQKYGQKAYLMPVTVTISNYLPVLLV